MVNRLSSARADRVRFLRLAIGSFIRGKERVMITITITNQTHPRICFFFCLIEKDNGGHLIGTVYPGTPINMESFEIPETWGDHLEAAERGLATLSDLGVGELAMGEEQTALALAAKSEDIAKAYALGNAYFEGWEQS